MAVDGWMFQVQDGLPDIFDRFRTNAVLCEELELQTAEHNRCFVAASRGNASWPELVVAQHYKPAGGGFSPGIAFVAETQLLFVGAGTRLLAYQLSGSPRRLWEDSAEAGFWSWSVHGSTVLMAAELELAAWDSAGSKLWTTFVEPPWSFSVEADRVHLDVMAITSEFSLTSGPAS